VAVASAGPYAGPHTDNDANTAPLSFLQAGCPSCHQSNSVVTLKAVLFLELNFYTAEGTVPSPHIPCQVMQYGNNFK